MSWRMAPVSEVGRSDYGPGKKMALEIDQAYDGCYSLTTSPSFQTKGH